MAKRGKAFEHQSLQDRAGLVQYLRAIADGLEEGRLNLSADGESLELDPNHVLRFTLKAKRGSYRSKVVLSVAWREPRSAMLDQTPLEIRNGPSEES